MEMTYLGMHTANRNPFSSRAPYFAADLGSFFLPIDFGSFFAASVNLISANSSEDAAEAAQTGCNASRSFSVIAFWHHW